MRKHLVLPGTGRRQPPRRRRSPPRQHHPQYYRLRRRRPPSPRGGRPHATSHSRAQTGNSSLARHNCAPNPRQARLFPQRSDLTCLLPALNHRTERIFCLRSGMFIISMTVSHFRSRQIRFGRLIVAAFVLLLRGIDDELDFKQFQGANCVVTQLLSLLHFKSSWMFLNCTVFYCIVHYCDCTAAVRNCQRICLCANTFKQVTVTCPQKILQIYRRTSILSSLHRQVTYLPLLSKTQ